MTKVRRLKKKRNPFLLNREDCGSVGRAVNGISSYKLAYRVFGVALPNIPNACQGVRNPEKKERREPFCPVRTGRGGGWRERPSTAGEKGRKITQRKMSCAIFFVPCAILKPLKIKGIAQAKA